MLTSWDERPLQQTDYEWTRDIWNEWYNEIFPHTPPSVDTDAGVAATSDYREADM